MAEISVRYCFSMTGLMKWFIIITSGVVLGLLLYEDIEAGERHHATMHDGEMYTVIVAAGSACVCFFFLLIFFLGCHQPGGLCSNIPCGNLVLLMYLISGLAWLAAGGVEAWAANHWKSYKGESSNHWFERRCAAAALSFLNGLIFLFQSQNVKTRGDL